MKNIWYIFGVVVFASIGLIITCIVITVKKERHYILIDIILMIAVIYCLIADIPYMKDLAEQQTTEVVAVYVRYQIGNVDVGANKLFFENEDGEFDLVSPTVTKIHVKMEPGKTYKIEYFNNSKVVKSYTIIE